MFKVGEKIVCITDFDKNRRKIDIDNGTILPKLNEIYTVRDTFANEVVRLVEIVNKPIQYQEGFTEISFRNIHFRKLDYDFADNLLKEITEQVKQDELIKK